MTRYFVFYDSDGQVQATQSSPNPPAETAWERSGLSRLEVTGDEIKQIDRDKKITVKSISEPEVRGDVLDTVTASKNAVQPKVSSIDTRLAELRPLFTDGTATLPEVIEYIKLRDGLA